MDQYADIYYVDAVRNATANDHRTGGPVPVGRPVPIGAIQSAQPVRTVYVNPTGQPVAYPYGTALPYPYNQMVPSYPYGAPSTAASLLGRLSTGDVIDLVAQALAAIQGLPAAPVATKDVGTDVGNLILFQNALAQHAKRDEQLRTIGNLVSKLVG